ncbi:TPA: phage holin, lambda family [Mannheimia haemolytica]|nr:phage holin, lambda family [Mannheimia haemolytica]
MPEKNPDIYTQAWNYFAMFVSNHSSFICAVIIAFFTSITKSFLYGKTDTPKRVFAEAILCAVIAGSLRPILIYFNADVSLITPIGAGIGLLGTSAIRQMILKFLSKKAGVDDNVN